MQGCVLLVARKLLLHSAPKPLHPGRGQLALDNSLSIGEGVQQEDAFFRNTEPWKNVEDRTLFGTSASDISASSIVMYTLVHLKSFRLPSSQELRTKLSKLLMELIRTSFKDIVAEMRQKRGEALVDYEALGSIPSDLADKRALFLHIRKEILVSIDRTTLDGPISVLQGGEEEMRPSARFHEAAKSYQDSLSKSKFATISDVSVRSKVIAIGSDDKEYKDIVVYIDSDSIYLRDAVYKYNVSSSTIRSSKKGPGIPFLCRSFNKIYIEREVGTFDELAKFDKRLVRNDPQWISDHIKNNRPYKLPIFINTHVFDAIVASLIDAEWTEPSLKLLHTAADLMGKAAESFIKGMSEIKSFPSLEDFLLLKASEVIESIKDDAKSNVLDFIKREKTPVRT